MPKITVNIARVATFDTSCFKPPSPLHPYSFTHSEPYSLFDTSDSLLHTREPPPPVPAPDADLLLALADL